MWYERYLILDKMINVITRTQAGGGEALIREDAIAGNKIQIYP